MGRAFAGLLRTLIGFSDVWSAVVGAGAVLTMLASVTPLGGMRWAWFVFGAAYVVWCGVMPGLAAIRRRTRLSAIAAISWSGASAIVAGGAAWVVFGSRGLEAYGGIAALAGIALAAAGLVADLVVASVGAFGGGRALFAFRPGMLLAKVALACAAAGSLVYTAGAVGSRTDDWVALIGFWVVLAVGGSGGLLLAPAFATYADATPGRLLASVPDGTIGRGRHRRSRRGRHALGTFSEDTDEE